MYVQQLGHTFIESVVKNCKDVEDSNKKRKKEGAEKYTKKM